jgi:signal transduction histidine kinase
VETFPSSGLSRVVVVVGLAGAVTASVLFVYEFRDDVTGLAWGIPFVGGYVAGVVAFVSRPEHLAARRLLAFGATATLWIGGTLALARAVEAYSGAWWFGPSNVALQILGLMMYAGLVALLAVYPDGAYGHRVERGVARLITALAAGVPIALLAAQSTLHPAWVFSWNEEDSAAFPEIGSPIHVGALSFLAVPLRVYHDTAVVVAPLVGVGIVVLRYRRLREQQRLQLRWPMYGVLVVLLAPLSAALHAMGALSGGVSDALVIVALAALPTSVVVGLLRPDLFDVDRAMRRSLVYAPLWIAIAGAYVGVAVALGFAASGQGLQVTIAVTILATVLFEPVRRHLSRRAARWAYGVSLSREELVQRIGQTLEHTHDLEQLTAAIAETAREGLGVRWARIDLNGGLLRVETDQPEDPAMTAQLVHAGEHLGEIACGPRIRGHPRPSDQELLETLARQASLAIHNARLASELALKLDEIEAQAAELAASRSRIVAAQEATRRQIERNIHDGAQQEIVALIANIAMARNQLDGGSTKLDQMLADLQTGARQALENLRQLAAGIHPPVLSDHGLVEAIESLVPRLPLEVSVDYDPRLGARRFNDEVEGAAWFFFNEAVANAIKHAGAKRARVRIAVTDGAWLELDVSDDGVGFEASATSGSGLRGLSDRIHALGGEMGVDSSPGGGTRLVARLPMGGSGVA